MTGLRDDRADLEYFQELRSRLQQGVELFRADVGDPSRVGEDRVRDAQHYFAYALNLVKCAYGMGESAAVIAEHADELLRARASYLQAQHQVPSGPYAFDVDRAQYVLPVEVLAIARLTDRPIQSINEIVELNGNLGVDTVYDFLAQPQNPIQSPGSVAYPKPYQQLLAVIEADPGSRPALMKAFLKVWYSQNRGLVWWGQHTTIPKGRYMYVGYWCFEAAAVTKLLDIDDSSYRDNQYYPRDLV